MAVKLPLVYDEMAQTHRPMIPGAETLPGDVIQISSDENNAVERGSDGGLWVDSLGGGGNPANLISGDAGNIITLGTDSRLLTLAPQINYPALISSDAANLLRTGSDMRLYARTPQSADFISAQAGNQLTLSSFDQRLFMGVPSADLFISTNANNAITTGSDGLLFAPTLTAADLVSPASGNALQATGDGRLFVNVMESIQIDASDQILTRSVVGIRGNVSLNYVANTRTVQLLGKNSTLISSFVLPEAALLQSAEVVKNPVGQPAGTYLRLTFNLSSGATETVYVDLAALATVYTAGDNSIDITNFAIRVKIDPNAPFSLSASGLALTYNKLISSDANNMITTGADGKLRAIHPANSSFISTNANNALVLGSDGKFFVPVAVIPGASTTVPKVASGTGAVGTGTTWARADHVHPAQAVPAASSTVPLIAGVGAIGTGTTFARADHVHPAQAVPAPATVAPLIAGTAAVGTSALYARQDHVHPAQSVPAPATVAPLALGTAAVGTSTLYARQDHVHPLQTTITGNAATATKLTTSRTFQTNLALETAVGFDGTANNVHGVTGILPISHGGTGGNTAAAARTNLGVVSIAGDTMTGGLVVKNSDNTSRTSMWSGSVETPHITLYNDLGTGRHQPTVYFRGRRDDGTLCSNLTYLCAYNAFTDPAIASGTASDSSIVMQSGGALYCGSGESATNVRHIAAGATEFPAGWASFHDQTKIFDNSEYTFICSDQSIIFTSGNNTVTNSSLMYFSANGHLIPGQHRTQDIGNSLYNWRYGYFGMVYVDNGFQATNVAGTSRSYLSYSTLFTPSISLTNKLATGQVSPYISFVANRADGTTQSTNTIIRAYADGVNPAVASGTASDSSLVIHAGGVLFAGGGECAITMRNVAVGTTAIPAGWGVFGTTKIYDDNEHTFVGSDTNIYFVSNVASSSNSKMATFNSQGHFLPGATDTQQLGSTAWRWGNVFAKTITADTITATTVTGGTPKPSEASGIGQWRDLVISDSGAFTPPGGTWAYFALGPNSIAVDNGYALQSFFNYVGVLAGGTRINYNSGTRGFCWRIA